MWKCGFQIVIVYLNFNAPHCTPINFKTKSLMYRTYFVKLHLGDAESWKIQITFMVTLDYLGREKSIICTAFYF